MIRNRLLVSLLTVACLLWLAGCGTDLATLLAQTTSAAGQTFLDQLLTDVANDVADSQAADGDVADDDPDDGDGADDDPDDGDGADDDPDDGDGADDDPDDGGDPADGSPFADLVGDAAAGEALYANCTACHCEDAGGGCLAGAPELVGVEPERLDTKLRGGESHIGGAFDLTDQEVVDLSTHLAALGDGTDDDPFADLTGDPLNGQILYSTCGGCHCPDASGGCLPGAAGLIGVEATVLDEFLRQGAAHAGGASDLNDQEIVDLQTYLENP